MAMTVYNKFSVNDIFDPEMNTFLNQMYSLLINTYSEEEVEANVVIDGSIALYLQHYEEEFELDLSHVPITVNSEKIFRFLCAAVQSLDITSSEVSGDYLVIKVLGRIVRVEPYYLPITVVTSFNIKLRDKNEII